ncbi:MAG TPA: membrane protein insertase YidC [Streptosporangiaceae bacterium]|nr:membrane protein insertase YidC [Streptosporangiaceae bacterium]
MSVLFGIPVDLAYHLVCWFAAILGPLLGGLAAAAAIVLFTMAVRLVLLPLSYYAFRGERARSRLQPKVQELQWRHAKDPERLHRELTALYRTEGTSMFAGCLPLLLQLPFFSLMYRLFLSRSVAGTRNSLLSHRLLAAPLGSWWLGGAGPFSAQGAVFAAVFVLLALVGLAAMRAARRARAEAAGAAAAGRAGVAGQAGAGAAAGPGSEPAVADRVVGWLSRVMPFGSLVMAAIVPLAAGLYLLTTASWTLAERAAIKRWSRVAQRG